MTRAVAPGAALAVLVSILGLSACANPSVGGGTGTAAAIGSPGGGMASNPLTPFYYYGAPSPYPNQGRWGLPGVYGYLPGPYGYPSPYGSSGDDGYPAN